MGDLDEVDSLGMATVVETGVVGGRGRCGRVDARESVNALNIGIIERRVGGLLLAV